MEREKIALITGGTRGIGKAIALKLFSIGYKICINGVSSEIIPRSFLDDANRFCDGNKDLHDKISYIQANISQSDDRDKLVEFIKEKFGRIDILVNNAGVAPTKRIDLLDATEESYDRVLNTNLKGPYFLTQKISKFMIEGIESEKFDDYKPKIINVSSISAFTSSPSRGEYCLSKAGISMMTKLYADRLSEFRIPVFEIQPGIIKTDMTSSVNKKYDELFAQGITPIKRWGLPDDIAEAVIGIANDRFPYSTGQVFYVDGGFHLRRL